MTILNLGTFLKISAYSVNALFKNIGNITIDNLNSGMKIAVVVLVLI